MIPVSRARPDVVSENAKYGFLFFTATVLFPTKKELPALKKKPEFAFFYGFRTEML